MRLKVKQIDEFMRRFNFDTAGDGSTPADTASTEDRLKEMYTVFRLKNFTTETGRPDSMMTGLCRYAIDNDVRLRYEDNNWAAKVICNAKIDNKKTEIHLFLQPEHIRDVLYKWVLTDADADFMQPLSANVRDSLFISPAEHGISFITLPRIINLSVADVNSIFRKDWIPDRLSIFSYLVSTGRLSISSVSQVIYHWNLDEYSFDVERFEGEDTPNQGWLISKITDNTKTPSNE